MPEIMPMIATEAALLSRGGHIIRHEGTHIVMGETEPGSEWKVRAVAWEPGEEPMLYLVGKGRRTTWVPFGDVEIGMEF